MTTTEKKLSDFHLSILHADKALEKVINTIPAESFRSKSSIQQIEYVRRELAWAGGRIDGRLEQS